MMSNDECAKFIGVAPGTLRNWRGKKKGPTPHKLGGEIVYRERDVEIWLSKRKMTGFESDDPQVREVYSLPVQHGRKAVPRLDRLRGHKTMRERREDEMKEAEARLSRSNSS